MVLLVPSFVPIDLLRQLPPTSRVARLLSSIARQQADPPAQPATRAHLCLLLRVACTTHTEIQVTSCSHVHLLLCDRVDFVH